MKLEQLKMDHNTKMEEINKRNDSLLEDCERYREVGWPLLLAEG